MRILRIIIITMALVFAAQTGYELIKPKVEAWVQEEARRTKLTIFKLRYYAPWNSRLES